MYTMKNASGTSHKVQIIHKLHKCTHSVHHLYLMLECDVTVSLLKQLVDTLIKGRDDFLRVLHQLSVQLRAEMLDVGARDVQVGFL